jgi:transcriptional regulatory protein LEU3
MQTTQKSFLPSVSQSFIDRTITLAGFTILRLMRSPLAQHLGLLAGEQAYHQAIQFLKNVSLQRGDIHYRTAYIMSDLWGSDKVFRNKDGHVESLYLRLRTRLSMSVSYDMFWYWREEFNKMQNPYEGEDVTLLSNNAAQQNTPRKPPTLFCLTIADEQAKLSNHNLNNDYQTLP